MSDEVSAVPQPGELVELPPGPQLAAALAQVDPATLNGDRTRYSSASPEIITLTRPA